MSTNRLEVKNVFKDYKHVSVLSNINLTLENGIYGLIGNNGAGKSTLLNILTSIIQPSKGEVLYCGSSIIDNEDYRNVLGYVPQILELPDYMSVEQYLYYVAALKCIPKKKAKVMINELLNQLNLEEKRYSITNTLSGGQRQRVLIAQSLLNNPKIVFMDEPTAGLDPLERKKLREFIVSIAREKIILITTHVITDIEYIADKIILLKNGEICKEGNYLDVLKEIDVFESIMNLEEYDEFNKHNKIVNVSLANDKVLVRHFNSDVKGIKVPAKLEDVYIKELS